MVKRKVIEIDEELCDGCGNCVVACEEGALQIIDGKAKVVNDKFCDGFGACIGDCPTGALKIIEREAEEFDNEAVKEHLKDMEKEKPLACGCPGTAVQTLNVAEENETDKKTSAGAVSRLTNWPVQLKLVPINAPYFNGAKLLIVADCVAYSLASLHEDFIKDKITLIGCPKLDDSKYYEDKLIEIFKNNDIKDITLLYMEVPCCSGLVQLVKIAVERSWKNIPLKNIMISVRGDIIKR